ncbi:MAG: YihY/virulence factor BrkB family protein [Acidobacteria bacterium]|nr:YihY/virulence factor BrkB family protein [Acidobacteriota bacterium]
MNTSPIEPAETDRLGASPHSEAGGILFYLRGSLAFFRKMWPAVYDLTTTETYVNASAIAFNIILSFFSFVVLIGSFLINVLHWRGGYETFYLILRSLAPGDSSQVFRSLDRVTQGPGGRATLVSFALLIFSTLGIFQPIEMALNRAWGFTERKLARQYLAYLGLTIGCALVMLGLILLGSLFNSLLELITTSVATRAWAFRYIGPIISLPFIFLLVFGVYYLVPNGRIDPGQLVFTSAAMAILWVLMTLIYRVALPLFDFEGSYNQLAGIMSIITWVLITSFILILGANLASRDILPRAGSTIIPMLRRENSVARD